MVFRVVACLAAFFAVLECHPSEATVRCILTTQSGLGSCEGDYCSATFYADSEMRDGWSYRCKVYTFGDTTCEPYGIVYRANYHNYDHVFTGCCDGNWCSNETMALSMPPQYYEYIKSLETSSVVDPFPSSSVSEIGAVLTSSISTSSDSVTSPPSASHGITGISAVEVVQSSACDPVTTTTGQPSREPPTGTATGNTDYATLSFMLIILVCFLILVIALMFVAMIIWWVVWHRRLEQLTRYGKCSQVKENI